MVEIYYFEYQYYDRRHYLKSRSIAKHNKLKAMEYYKELKLKMQNNEQGSPIELPHVTVIRNGEAKMVDAENELV